MIDYSPIAPVEAALRNRRKSEIADGDLAQSAVLVPLFVQEGGLGALFIRRTDRVERHKGEYCFPGGFAEPQDRSLVDTALRECAEELGVDPTPIRILGELDDVRTMHRVRIAPFVGAIPYPCEFVPSEDEVDAIVPLTFDRLLCPGTRSVEIWRRPHPDFPEGEPRHVTFYRVDDHVIWGATARILDQLFRAIGRLS